MLFEIMKFEILHRLKRFDTYIYFIILFLFALVAIDFYTQGLDLGLVKKNSPTMIAKTMSIVTGFLMVICSIIMGMAIIRDFEHNMESLMFINPIEKRDYLLGRFLGAFAIILFIFSGLLFGMIVSEFMPWHKSDQLLPLNLWSYLYPYITIVLPTLFFGSAIFFVSAVLSRKLIVVYTQGIFFFIIFMLSKSIDHEAISALLDPFSFGSLNQVTEFWTSVELNNLLIPFDGLLLYNRLFWIIVGCVTFLYGFKRFSFVVVRDNPSKKKHLGKKSDTPSKLIDKVPAFTLDFGIKSILLQIKSQSLFYFTNVFKETSFRTILFCGIVIVFVNGVSLGSSFGVNSYPKSYLIVQDFMENSLIFFFVIFLFFSADLIWKERETKINLIYDSLPTHDFVNILSKFIGLSLIYIVLIFALILSGIIYQMSNGYYEFELSIYFKSFFIELFPSLVLYSFIAFFLQIIVNNKFLAQILTIVFIIINTALPFLGFEHGLFVFGSGGVESYSDMNGYGHFITSFSWFKIYWISFSILLLVITSLFIIRGTESNLRSRITLAKNRITKPHIIYSIPLITLFVLSGVYIFYNTTILNSFITQIEANDFRVNYEKQLKHFEYLNQPKIIDVKLSVELYPSKQRYDVDGTFLLKNISGKPISEIHIQKFMETGITLKNVTFSRDAEENSSFNKFGYVIYKLDRPLAPNDSIQMKFSQHYLNEGFTESPNTQLVYNGTFFDNYLLLPSLGYNKKYELRENDIRKEYNLPPRQRRAKINDSTELTYARTGDDGYYINLDMIIGTEDEQTALSSGNLINTWKQNGRNYFHYKTPEPIINFYPIVSAKYETMKSTWSSKVSPSKSIDLEIYYHKGHKYNLDRMMTSMKHSLDYFSTEFSPFQYKQMRIVEIPHYRNGAVSLPNIIGFTENSGFIMNIQDEKDIDMPFFITAHEMAHQWWGLQVAAANVQGRSMILESLAQYSAIMMMKRHFPKSKILQLLNDEHERYLRGRKKELDKELPLALVEKHKHIHYGKGAANLYALQSYISEDSVNSALKRFIKDWKFEGEKQKKKYATTDDLIGYFKEVTPDSMIHIIDDLFYNITLHENQILNTELKYTAENKYQLTINISTEKFHSDSLGNEVDMPLNEWIDIAIKSKTNKNIEKRIHSETYSFNKQKNTIIITTDQKPSSVIIDPDLKFIDRNRKNNSKEVFL